MAALYHVFILPKTGVTRDAVDNALNEAEDWVRYHNTCYVIQTTNTAKYWSDKLSPLVGETGHLFVCKLDAEKFYGRMAKTFWEWYEPKAPLADK